MAWAINGTVYTRDWVVDLILDLAGYTADKDLCRMKAVEPSCGMGAFAKRMVARILESCTLHNRDISEASDALRCIDLDECSVEKTGNAIKGVLRKSGVPENTANALLGAWMLADDYILADGFSDVDFVVGNPPYIRSNDIEAELKSRYLHACRMMTPGSDLFVGFIEKGLESLGEGGTLSFICADRWMHNSYGRKIREQISTQYQVESIVVMHDVDTFEFEVSAYPAIVTIKRAKPKVGTPVAFAREQFGRMHADMLLEAISSKECLEGEGLPFEVGMLPKERITSNSWPLVVSWKQKMLDYLEDNFPVLEESAEGTQVGIGMATGNDKVYIVSAAGVVEADRMVPLCTSKQLNAGAVHEKPLWLVNPWTDEGLLVDLDEYPRLSQYLGTYYGQLSSRHIARKDANAWFRTIDKYRAGLANRPKLLIQDMHARFEPHYDCSHYPHGNLYYIVSDEWDLEVLGGLLMSDLCEIFVDAYGVKMRGGTLRFQAQFLRKIRVPYWSSLEDSLKSNLKRAFREKDYDLANTFAREAFEIEGCHE